jgi:hypothetical protein
MLSLIIPGPRAPGMNIDVYLQPLVHELMELWDVGVTTYDVSSKKKFTMRATLMWTINDFPAYADLLDGVQKALMHVPVVWIQLSLFG